MINPTFASFKHPKQPHPPSALAETNFNIQPRTFHDVKSANNSMLGPSRITQMPYDGGYGNISATGAKKNVINFHMKKSHTHLNMLGIEEGKVERVSRQKINKNVMTAKKNYVHVDRASRDKNTSRPTITGPTLLKNKSFIYTLNN